MRKAQALQPSQPIEMTVPLFGRVLKTRVPPRFLPTYRAQSAKDFIFEFVPDGEAIETWTRIYTITSSRGIGSFGLDDAALATAIVGSSSGCAGTPEFKILRPIAVEGGATGVAAVKSCSGLAVGSYKGAVIGSSEKAVIVFMRDASDIYTIQLARRGTDAPARLLTDAEIDSFVKGLGTVFLCDAASPTPGCKTVVAVEAVRAHGAMK